MEKMQLHYHEEANKKGVYIISSCGMDSIPADLGAMFMMKNFRGISMIYAIRSKMFYLNLR